MFPYKKPLQHLLTKSSQMNNEYVTREYTRSMHVSHASITQRKELKDSVFKTPNNGLDAYNFDLRTSPKANVETDIITEGSPWIASVRIGNALLKQILRCTIRSMHLTRFC